MDLASSATARQIPRRGMRDPQNPTEHQIVNGKRVIVEKAAAVRQVVMDPSRQKKMLNDGFPGTGKTMLAKSLARSMGCIINRTQRMPHMLPSDGTDGSSINRRTAEFEHRLGPIMAQALLPNEIARAMRNTPAALPEAIEEGKLAVDDVVRRSAEPFLGLARQNTIGDDLGQVVDVWEMVAVQQAVPGVRLSSEVQCCVVDLVNQARRHHEVCLRATPPGSLVAGGQDKEGRCVPVF